MVSDHDLALKKGLAWTPVLSQFIEGRKSLKNYVCSQTLLCQGFSLTCKKELRKRSIQLSKTTLQLKNRLFVFLATLFGLKLCKLVTRIENVVKNLSCLLIIARFLNTNNNNSIYLCKHFWKEKGCYFFYVKRGTSKMTTCLMFWQHENHTLTLSSLQNKADRVKWTLVKQGASTNRSIKNGRFFFFLGRQSHVKNFFVKKGKIFDFGQRRKMPSLPVNLTQLCSLFMYLDARHQKELWCDIPC